ncbi:response regulator [Microvirga rosea]|uniref:response regulator n=1 Tax=Microvirga rosea TaxID=2715425 RepID=UPI001D0BBF36|nr:response regulator [Microvirga rosea]MCB8820902.1 response regulator [Microvirga rosea]
MMSATQDMTADKPDLTGCRVLLVEDEYYIADDLCQALEQCGAIVVGPVPSLDKALALAESERLTCAVLDMDLRGESGLGVAEILRRRNVPFIYSTGYSRAVVPETLKGAAHLEKPFRIEELLHAVNTVFRNQRLGSAATRSVE